MPDYLPLSLDTVLNTGIRILGDSTACDLGDQDIRGLPFSIPTDPDLCLVHASAQGGDLAIAVHKRARHCLILHRLLESRILEGGPVGVHVADYVLRYADGSSHTSTVRERFEIGAVTTPRMHANIAEYGHVPFLASVDVPSVYRAEGEFPYDPPGHRQPQVANFYLFIFANPEPEKLISELRIVPQGPPFVIGGITLGLVDEYPLPREPARPVLVEIASTPLRKEGLSHEVTLSVDRGHTSTLSSLPQVEATEYLRSDMAGFGDERRDDFDAGYSYVTAVPSATLSVQCDGQTLGEVGWRHLLTDGEVTTGDVTVRVSETGRNWIRTRVVDDATGVPVPCRIHFRSVDGVPYPPDGHHATVRTGLWNASIGGDVRLGQAVYAYIDGTCEGWLPQGHLLVDVARGFEYEPVRERVTIAPGQQELTLRLRRWCDLRSEGWFSGDTHVHFLSTQGGHAEAQGEDLAVVNLLLSRWGDTFTNVEDFIGRPHVSDDGSTIVYASQENRQHLLGHLTLLGLKRPVYPWCSDGLNEAEFGGSIEATLSHWADECHAQGGTVVIPHLPVPNGEPAALIATGRADATEFLVQHPYFHQEYYRYLNCGYRLPLVGGTDKMSSEVPVGLYRTYVHTPEEFTYENWCNGLAAGRTFVSGGPIISLSVDGHSIGDTISLPPGGGTVEVHAQAESIFPITRLELVQHGTVVAATECPTGSRRLELRERLRVSGHTWLAARTSGGRSYFESPAHHDLWARRIMAHTSPIYVACGGEWELFDAETTRYMLTLVSGSLSHIRESALRYPPASVTHRHGEADHLAFLERPLQEAVEALHRRLHRFGIPH